MLYPTFMFFVTTFGAFDIELLGAMNICDVTQGVFTPNNDYVDKTKYKKLQPCSSVNFQNYFGIQMSHNTFLIQQSNSFNFFLKMLENSSLHHQMVW